MSMQSKYATMLSPLWSNALCWGWGRPCGLWTWSYRTNLARRCHQRPCAVWGETEHLKAVSVPGGDNHTDINHQQDSKLAAVLNMRKDKQDLKDRRVKGGGQQQRKRSQSDSELSILLFRSITPTSSQAWAIAACWQVNKQTECEIKILICNDWPFSRWQIWTMMMLRLITRSLITFSLPTITCLF